MPLRGFIFMLVFMGVISADFRPEGAFWQYSAAFADDDDDDDDGGRSDDDDDDDGVVIRRQVQPQRRVRAAPAPPPPSRAPDEVIARGLNEEDLAGLQTTGFELIRQVELSSGQDFVRLRKPEALDLEEARQVVRDLDPTGAADFNHYYRPENDSVAEPDCPGGICPARQMIAWPVGVSGCGNSPRIGMVDTDLNAEHDALRQARVTIRRIDNGQNAAASERLHGTAVAALLVGQQDSRAPGLVPHAELIAVDAFYKVGSDERANAFALIEALDYLVAEDVDIVNMSLSGPANDALADQIRQMAAQDIVLVAAAGNGGPASAPSYPAAYDDVIAVTAVDRDARVYRRASRGPYIDIAAPGVDVWTAASISGRRGKTGTSYAAPFVTAAAALLMQARPDLSAGEIREIIQASAEDLGEEGRDEIFGYGLLQPVHPCE